MEPGRQYRRPAGALTVWVFVETQAGPVSAGERRSQPRKPASQGSLSGVGVAAWSRNSTRSTPNHGR